MTVYGPWLADVLTDHFAGRSVNAMLVTSSYSPDPDHHFRDQVVGEAAGAGYSAGGVAVTGLSVSYDAAADAVRIRCDDVDFGQVTLPDVAGIVFYVAAGSAATDVLIASDLFPAVEVLDAVTFTYQISPDGLVVVTTGGP